MGGGEICPRFFGAPGRTRSLGGLEVDRCGTARRVAWEERGATTSYPI
jgi:hypothetical protein